MVIPTSIIQLKVISIHLIPPTCHERSLGLSPPILQEILVSGTMIKILPLDILVASHRIP